ncbi:unnamed protein product [Ceutorhynchus assimilis]|uniref:Poly [ADP-ribose] polymerase n=1 Tax=Ceutorhynchus assimilis TaxID=467358 RepID=A0A9N9QM52_9CUCU|nr:unnamed protein product [Ceutorhynchus assimilis]
MGICCSSYCTERGSFIDDTNSFSSSAPVLPVVSETTRFYEEYQENLRKTRLNSWSTTRKSDQSNFVLPNNLNRAPQTLINQPMTTPGATSTRNLDTNFNTSNLEVSSLNKTENLISYNENNLQIKSDNWQLWEWKQEPQTLFEIENLEISEKDEQTDFSQTPNGPKLFENENLQPETKKRKQTFLEPLDSPKLFEIENIETSEKDEQPNFSQTPNSPELFENKNPETETKHQEQTFLKPSDSPKLFEIENIEADTNKEKQTRFLEGLINSPRSESIESENLESETTELKQTDFIERLTKQKVVRNLELINDLRAAFNLNHLETFPENPYQEEQLDAIKYIEVANIFTMTNKPYFTITKITAINNIFLELHFKLNTEIYKKRNPELLVNDKFLFHGTKLEFLKRICTYNFDRAKVCTHKFGHGVSFAVQSSYATHYHHDNKRKYEKVMIIAKALLEETLPLGTLNTVVPPEPFYTSRNIDASVIVKYDDASFYPLYIVYYSGLHPKKNYPHKRPCRFY